MLVCNYFDSERVTEFIRMFLLGGGNFVQKLADAVVEMIWKYNIIPFDRFILCMVSCYL